MPMNEGFLRCHEFYRDEKIRRDRDRFAVNFFAHDNARAANFAMQKNFRAECVFGRVEAPDEAQNARISAK